MKRHISILFGLASVTLAHCQTSNYWKNETSGLWHLPANWTLNTVPTATQDILLGYDYPGRVFLQPELLTARILGGAARSIRSKMNLDLTAGTLEIRQGGLQMQGAAKLVITSSASSPTLFLNGTQVISSHIQVTGSASFRSSGTISLASNTLIEVSGANINLNGRHLGQGVIDNFGTIWVHHGAWINYFGSRLNNYGTIRVGKGSSTGEMSEQLHNFGKLDITDGGSMDIPNNFSNSGQIRVSGANSVLEVNGPQVSSLGNTRALDGGQIKIVDYQLNGSTFDPDRFGEERSVRLSGTISNGSILNSDKLAHGTVTYNDVNLITGLRVLRDENVTLGADTTIQQSLTLDRGQLTVNRPYVWNIPVSCRATGELRLLGEHIIAEGTVFRVSEGYLNVNAAFGDQNSLINRGLIHTNKGDLNIGSGVRFENFGTWLATDGGRVNAKFLNSQYGNRGTLRAVGPNASVLVQSPTALLGNIVLEDGAYVELGNLQNTGATFDLADFGPLGSVRMTGAVTGGLILHSELLDRSVTGTFRDVTLDNGLTVTRTEVQLAGTFNSGARPIVLDGVNSAIRFDSTFLGTGPRIEVRSSGTQLRGIVPAGTSVHVAPNARISSQDQNFNGDITIDPGARFTIAGGFTPGAVRGDIMNNGTFAGPLNLASGNLRGKGLFLENVVINGGTLSPGDGIGTPTFQSNLTLSSGSLSLMQIVSSTQSDSVTVVQNLVLGGTLRVAVDNAENISPGTRFVLFQTSGSLTGEFAGIDVPAQWRLTSANRQVVLEAVPEPGTLAVLSLGLFIIRRKAKVPRCQVNVLPPP